MFRRQLLLSFFALFLSVILLHSPVDALTVSPVKLELRGDPGTTTGGTFQLINEQDETLTFYVSYANFEAQGEDGVPHFVDSTSGLATWMRLVPNEMNSVTLEPGTSVDISYEVLIPSDAQAGGYFGAIFWGSSPANGEASEALAVGAKVGILVFLTVNGDVEEGGGLLEFGTKDDQSFFTSLPVHFFYRFSNDGGDRIIPTGTLSVKNVLGMTTAVLPLNSAESNVLPTSTRRFEELWGNALTLENPSFFEIAREQWGQFAFGRYTAELSLSYGSEASTVTSSVQFWVFPWQLLLLLGGGGFVLLALLVFTVKRYNHWIVARAMKDSRSESRSKVAPKKSPARVSKKK